ncbi:MAG: DinB family protein [Thermoanaerobaculia bacterium]
MRSPAGFLDHPGLPGPFGALMDEYDRAAEDLCATAEALPQDLFLRQVPSPDPDLGSIQAILLHVVRAAHGYANYIRKARDLPMAPAPQVEIPAPAALRPLLAMELRYTEGALEGLYDAPEEVFTRLTFQVGWGPTYDPEMLLEHAIVHLLRHRRQIERWGR